ncbi:flagellar hook-length control protein FliK [Desulfitobacterium sp.]|uniref:flagellar hook-length control protein FliK n=1 Tax=Desulfitobacterium sp. TaxID=49981 RepID=UPI002B2110DA|nr:flagellar hook-length control protein FliK [Desulfitobacterium sp.]MEA4900859.1 flagellar hook-length control protein FliK [Desulfitobacterium sp.]
MSEINVLVSGSVTPTVKGGSIAKGENFGGDSAALEFAALFSGWIAQAMGQGQDSGFQSNSDPAGKEANSGQTGIQGLEGMLGTLRTAAGLNLESVGGQNEPVKDFPVNSFGPEMTKLFSQENLFGDAADSGIGSEQLQTVKLPLSELDQYRVLITQLLQEMSGEISEVAVKPAEVQGLLSQLSQELNLNPSENTEQLLRNLLVQNKDRLQPQIQTETQVQNPIQPKDVQPESMPWTMMQKQGTTPAQSSIPNNIRNELQTNGFSHTMTVLSNETDITGETDLSGKTNTYNTESALSPEVAVNANPNGEKAEPTLRSTQDLPLEKGVQAEKPPIEALPLKINTGEQTGRTDTGKEKQNLSSNENGKAMISKDNGTESINSNQGNISFSNSVLNSVAEVGNRTAVSSNSPIWQQVAQQLQGKLLNQLPNVHRMNIQLHPAELGQISISVALDNGQVHLRMHASEAATGQVLQSNFPELRQSLSQAGIQCGMMEMGFADSNPNFNRGRNQTFTPRLNNQNQQATEDGLNIDEIRGEISSSGTSGQELGQDYRINVTA